MYTAFKYDGYWALCICGSGAFRYGKQARSLVFNVAFVTAIAADAALFLVVTRRNWLAKHYHYCNLFFGGGYHVVWVSFKTMG